MIIPRFISLAPPMVRVWNAEGTAVEHTARWNASINTYHFEILEWRQEDAPVTISESGIIRQHPRGVRLFCRLRFVICHPNYSLGIPRSGEYFSEVDLKKIQDAIIARKPIEFFPHGGGGASVNSAYQCNVSVINCGAGAGNWERQVVMEFQGRNLVPAMPPDF